MSQGMDMQVIKCKRSFWRQSEVSFLHSTISSDA